MNLKTIKSKLEKNDAIISKADKGDIGGHTEKRIYAKGIWFHK